MKTNHVAIRVDGLAELATQLRATPERLDKDLRKANKKAVQTVLVPAVKGRTAVGETGNLRRSTRALATARRAQLAQGSGAVPYAGPINFGWPARGIAPHEAIYSSIEATRSQLIDIYAEVVDKIRV